MNPKNKDTLERRVGLSAPLIRRGIFTDLDAVPMPDLVRVGEVAVQAARDHAPLVLGAPAADCQPFRDSIVALATAILTSETRDRVDVEILVNLSTGMTALIPDPARAVATVMYAVGLSAETLGWVRPGWVQLVTDFTLASPLKAARESEPQPTADEAPYRDRKETSLVPSPAIPLAPERQASTRRGSMPALDLSEELRRRLIWLAVETRLPVEDVMGVLLDHYVESLRNGDTIETLTAILRLAERLGMTSLDERTLHEYLTTREALAEHNCTFEDVPEALALVRILEELPISWDWETARLAITAVGAILTAGLTPENVSVFLERHRRFEELDVDERTAEAIAETMTRLAVPAEHRAAVMDRLVDNASRQVDVDTLTNEAAQLRTAIQDLKAEMGRLEAERQDVRSDIESLEGYRGTLRKKAARLEVECTRMETDLAVARGLRNFLLRKKPDVEAFFAELSRLRQWRRAGGRLDDAIGGSIVDGLHTKLLEFFQQLVAEKGREPTQ